MQLIQIGDWLFDSRAQQLIKDNETVQLEPISSDLLLCLVNYQSQIVSKDDLISHVWKNRIVSDSAITRVISMLRKHLGDDPMKPTYIRTVQKQGYVLLPMATELSEQEIKLYQHKRSQIFIRLLTVKNILIFTLFSITGWLSINNILKSQQPEFASSELTIKPILTEKGQEAFVTISPNDEFIIYSHTAMNGSYYHLYKKDLASGKVMQLTHGANNDFGASIDVNSQKIYFARLVPAKSCHIMRIDLSDIKMTSPEPIIECDKSLNFTNVEVHPNSNEIFYIDAASGLYVYRYNMGTKEKVRFSNLNQSRVTDYYQKLSPDGKKLVLVRFDNGAVKVVLKRLKQPNYEKVIWNSNGTPIYSVSWSKDSRNLYFLEKRHNQLVTYNLNNDHSSVHNLEHNRLNSLSNQTDNGDIFAILGNQTQYDISSVPITSEIEHNRTLVVASTANDLAAVQLSEHLTFYISDRSGMYQFWLRKNDGVEQQLTNFKENRSYLYLSAAPNGEYVVGLTDGRLFKFTLDTKDFTWLTNKDIKASRPFFSPDGILHYIVKGEKYVLMEYSDIGEDKPLIFGAVSAEYHAGKILYQDIDGNINIVKKGEKTSKLLIKRLTSLFQKRKWLSTEKGIYFNIIGNDTNRGLYFQSFDRSPPVLISSGEPNPFGAISYDRFNQRILLETEEDINTNIVKISFNHSEPDG